MPINTGPTAGFLKQNRPMGMMNKQSGMRANMGASPAFGTPRRPRIGGGGANPGMGGGPTDRITPMPGRIPGYTPPPQGMVKQPFPGTGGIDPAPGMNSGLPPGMNSTMPIDPNMSPIQKQPFPINTGPQMKPGMGGMPRPWMPPIRDDMGPGATGGGMIPGYQPPNMDTIRQGMPMPSMEMDQINRTMPIGMGEIPNMRRYFQ